MSPGEPAESGDGYLATPAGSDPAPCPAGPSQEPGEQPMPVTAESTAGYMAQELAYLVEPAPGKL